MGLTHLRIHKERYLKLIKPLYVMVLREQDNSKNCEKTTYA